MEARAEHGRKIQSYVRENRPGRNDQCPCGAGLGFKRCHGR
ncbi:SEC-C metal-binding domain-containing protein [Parvibaculum sp.]